MKEDLESLIGSIINCFENTGIHKDNFCVCVYLLPLFYTNTDTLLMVPGNVFCIKNAAAIALGFMSDSSVKSVQFSHSLSH